MEADFKTVKFGGYDKKEVDAYIEESEAAYEAEIEAHKATIAKLGDTVKNLHAMREVNVNESKDTIDNLKLVNEKLQAELDSLKEEMEVYRQRESESASRYESISRTLLEARESADNLTKSTVEECERKIAETTEKCEIMKQETEEYCEKLKSTTEEECERLTNKTQSSCQEMKETTYANCDSLKKQAREETDALKLETETACKKLNDMTNYECEKLKNDTVKECDSMKSQARIEAYNTRMTVKKECESIGEFITQLLVSVDNVNEACKTTKEFAETAFGDLSAPQA